MTLYGNLSGLKPYQQRQLERLYQQRLPQQALLTWELAQKLGSLAVDLGSASVSLFVNRRGQVLRVAVGNPYESQIPALELPRQGAERLSGIRCISTQSHTDPPSRKSLTAMALQRLDALMLLPVIGSGFQGKGGQAAGYVEQGYLAYLTPQWEADAQRWWHSDLLPLAQIVEQNVTELVEGLETEFRRYATAHPVDPGREQVILVGVQEPRQSHEDLLDRLTELGRLVDSAGGEVLHTLWQRRDSHRSHTMIGSGKVEELALLVQDLGASLVVVDRELSPSQGRTLENLLGVRVVDRNEVILDIFAQRAQSRAGKLQVELAQLHYLMPRLVGRGKTMSRLGGGIGTRGPGETQLEMERRAIQRRLSKLKDDVQALSAHRQRQRLQREQSRLPIVAIVGYTNAGKSTLLNALTQSDVYVADQLFATLDPTTRRLTTPTGGSLLITDTVGFLTELPEPLVDAFRSTLEEVTEADAVLHVVDLSHPLWEAQIEAVNLLLDQMDLATGPRQLVFNKIDRVDPDWIEDVARLYPRALFISAHTGQRLDALQQVLYRLASSSGTADHEQTSLALV